ncbi:hypothetical protein PIB30_077978 [Stylosanthes scabra]|uniref:Uncharacterized protein n=1 Tax=Stylosanthes scabra TaxID=79078 RepID=A0ABU6WQI9_9FABA|nr:hypothetical protein [Stylosanthes scabra]
MMHITILDFDSSHFGLSSSIVATICCRASLAFFVLALVIGPLNPCMQLSLVVSSSFRYGVVSTVAFKNITTRISQMNLGSSNDIGTSSTCGSSVQDELNTVKAQLQALASYIASKEGGKLPEHLAAMFPNEKLHSAMLCHCCCEKPDNSDSADCSCLC